MGDSTLIAEEGQSIYEDNEWLKNVFKVNVMCIWLFNYLSIMKTIAFVSITLLTLAKTAMPTVDENLLQATIVANSIKESSDWID